MPSASLLAIDWGTTSARAYALDDRGEVLERRSRPLGISQVTGRRYDAALQQLVAGWDEYAPFLASGMIGSRQGWAEAPYVECPARYETLATRLKAVDGSRLWIVPGLITHDERGIPDVLRGEETQLVGAVEPDEPEVVAVLPGTHSKWARVERGTIIDFATFMTGELYAVLLAHSILGRLADSVDGAIESAAFARGVEHGLSEGGLSHDLFAARTLALTGKLSAEDVAAWLSGLLIGREIRDARQWIGRRTPEPVRLIGDDRLCGRYEQALRIAEIPCQRGPADAAARGLWRIALAAGMVAK